LYTNFFDLKIMSHETWKIAETVLQPANRYNFTVNFRYLQAYNTILYRIELFRFNYTKKVHLSNKKKPVFSIL
jgi:hypothetical protein